MNFLLQSALANAGIAVVGGIADISAASRQEKLETLANEVNATSQKVQVARQYNNLFEKQVSELSTQKSILANLSIDKSSSFFGEALKKQEKNFLGTQNSMKEDYKNINSQKALANIGANMRKTQARSNSIMGIGTSLANISLDYAYKKEKGLDK